jgi:Skp family chaperone for outer membrane proteins
MIRVTTLLTACALSVTGSAFAQAPAYFLPQAVPQTVAPPPPAPVPATPSLLQMQAPAPFPAGVKFGFINLQTIAQESAAGKAASLQLKKLQDVKLLEVQAKAQLLKTLQDKQNAAAVMTASAAAQVQKDIERAQMELQYTQQTAQKEVEDLQTDLMNAFSTKVIPIVEQVRAEKGLWAVWSVDESLVAVMPGLDISMDVVKRLDALK